MASLLDKMIKELDSVEYSLDVLKIKVQGLRNQLLHFNGGAGPKRAKAKKISVSVSNDLAGSLKKSMIGK